MSNNPIPISKIISVLSGDEDIKESTPNIDITEDKTELASKLDSNKLQKSKLSKVKKSRIKKDVN